MILLTFLFFSFFSLFNSHLQHNCIHDKVKKPFKVSNSTGSRRGLIRIPRLVIPEFEPIRIHFDTTNIESDMSGDPRLPYILSSLLPAAQSWINRLLKTIPYTGKLFIPRDLDYCAEFWSGGKCRSTKTQLCGDVMEINPDHLEPVEICPTAESSCQVEGLGLDDTDMVIYVGSKSDDCSAGTVAYAMACHVNVMYYTPFSGIINLCDGYIDDSMNSVENNEYIHVIVHEVFHALGFSSDFFDFYMFPDGIGRVGLLGDNGVYADTTERGHAVSKIITENAVKAAREHFGCDTLTGIEIENQGAAGTVGSHTEMRIFRNDFMNGASSANPVFSPISLAIMEDSGWYKAQYEYAEILHFGKNAGCEFATQHCLTGDKSAPTVTGPKNHFCTVSASQACTADRKGIGNCDMSTTHTDIPSYFQYFTNTQTGGIYEVMDYCPYYQESVSCFLPENGDLATEQYGQEFGSDSLCLESSLSVSGSVLSETAKCYRYNCLSTTLMKVFISGGVQGGASNVSVLCSINEIDVPKNITNNGTTWEGVVLCPDVSLFCGEMVVFVALSQNSNLLLYVYIGLGVVGAVILVAICVGIVICLVSLCSFKKGNRVSNSGYTNTSNLGSGRRLGGARKQRGETYSRKDFGNRYERNDIEEALELSMKEY